MVDLPEIKTEEISSPKSAEESPHSLDEAQKVTEIHDLQNMFVC